MFNPSNFHKNNSILAKIFLSVFTWFVVLRGVYLSQVSFVKTLCNRELGFTHLGYLGRHGTNRTDPAKAAKASIVNTATVIV
jgi:hypothetical protein